MKNNKKSQEENITAFQTTVWAPVANSVTDGKYTFFGEFHFEYIV